MHWLIGSLINCACHLPDFAAIACTDMSSAVRLQYQSLGTSHEGAFEADKQVHIKLGHSADMRMRLMFETV